MEPGHSTDYFAVIPKVGLPGPVIPYPISAETFHWYTVADLSLLVLVLTTEAIVATVILNWSP
jgi:hypothetical protein